MNTLSTQQLRIVGLLSQFFGEEADAVYEASGRSLHTLVSHARDSALPGRGVFRAGLELAQEMLGEQLRSRPVFSTPEAVTQYLKLHFAGQQHESFVVLFLDAEHRLIADEEMFRGTLAQTSVYPREVVKQALHHNAAAVIFAHPHPSGVCEPSRADQLLTTALNSALSLVDVRVLDHFVIAGNASMSFAHRGLL